MKTAFIASLAAAAVVCAACSNADRDPFGANGSNAPSTDSTTALTVTPAADTVMVGDSVRFMVATHDSQPVSWEVGDSTIARIEGQGSNWVLLVAGRNGATTITATSSGRSGSAQLVVIERVPVASITIKHSADTLTAGDTASADTVTAGDSETFIATPRDAQGNPLSGRSVTWAVGDSSIARVEHTVLQTALVRALHQGTTTITAMSEGKSASAQLVVTAPPPVASVSVTPPADTVVVGEDSVFFSATLRDAQGRQLSGRIVTWTISDTSVARIVSSYGPHAAFRPAKPGSAVVTATSEGKSGTAQLVVIVPPPVASVTVSPPNDTAQVGEDSVSFSATLRDAQGRQLYGRIVTWTISDTSIARIVSSYGPYAAFRPVKAGSAVVTATSEGKSGTAQLVVIAPPPVASVTVSPPNDTARVGEDSVNFSATLRDAQGRPLSGRLVTWTISDTSIARILFSGGPYAALRPVKAGSAVVTATSEGKIGTAQLVVIAPPPVASVSVLPPNETVAAGDTVGFRVILRDAAGNPVYGRSVTWSVGDSSVARIEQTMGAEVVLRAVQEGTTTVTATSEGKSGTAQLVVTAPGPVASVTVSPPVDSSLVVGDTTFFVATLRDTQGNQVSGKAVTWTISDPSVARIEAATDQWAEIRALKVGSATLTAASEGKTGSASLVVR